MPVGDLIRDARRRRGLTQAQLAQRAGTSQPVVSAYENGHRDPTMATLRRLVEASGERLQVLAVAGPAAGALPPARDPHEHAARLLDVLSLADAVPARRRPVTLRAPRLRSRG